MPIIQGDRARVVLAAARQNSPEPKYHTPTTNICRGKKRQEANTPKLKINSHNPGSSQPSRGATLSITTVSRKPTITAGRNCSTADCTISRANPRCTRRARAKVSIPASDTETAAVPAHTATHDVSELS